MLQILRLLKETSDQSNQARLLEILEKDEIFKISVQPGGCNGFEYKFNVEKYRHGASSFCSCRKAGFGQNIDIISSTNKRIKSR